MYLFRDLLGKEDLLSIVRALLNLYTSKSQNATTQNIAYQHQFSSLLTIAAVELCKRIDDLSSFEEELFAALFSMWQTHPTEELDRLIADISEWASIPAYEDNATINSSIFASHERRIFIQKPKFIAASAVNTMLNSINDERARILSCLLKYRMDCRETFMKYLAKHDVWNLTLDQISSMMLSLLSGAQVAKYSQQPEADDSTLVDATVTRFLKLFKQPLLDKVFVRGTQDCQNGISQATRLLCEIAGLQATEDLQLGFLAWCKKPNVAMLNNDITTVFSALFSCSATSEDKVKLTSGFLNSFLSSLIRPIKKGTIKEYTKLEATLQQIMQDLVGINDLSLPDIDAEILQEYVLAVILDELDNPVLINFTTVLVNLVKSQVSTFSLHSLLPLVTKLTSIVSQRRAC